MKTKCLSLCALALAFFWTGCWQKSVYPFYKEKDLAFEPALLGSWIEPDKKPEDATTWTFTRGDQDRSYRVVIKDKENSYEFDGHVFKLDDGRFLDLLSRKRTVSEIPAHHLLRVAKVDSTLDLQILSLEWVGKWLKAHPQEIAHIYSSDIENPNDPEKGEMILTAETDRLQKFVRDHLKAEDFWSNMDSLRRQEAK